MGIEPVASSSLHVNLQRKGESEIRTQHREQSQQPAEQRLSSPQLELTKEDLEKTLKGLNEFLKPAYKTLRFELYEELDRYIVRLVDQESQEVIREIPPEKLLDMYVSMLQFVGLIVDEKV
ncbi:flagellar protein FlaG protein [Caldalkalibacillus thermarum TA2.A1]|uniref:Flagellar protein FlaG protein n=2 Tax=Caldalkalibacillus thermarum (strain TA2.A1) TaxID=986075 RepID=F5L4N2_CALTT|nr:flagellar protein FlaG [Caldalkalibacillus thermarum]EGL83698.1 flagellar protein FlaG protein [Caldalkalibacillus thermarum TA2.A1]